MNIYSMKELDHLAVDMINDAFGKMSTWCCCTDECEDDVSDRVLKEEEMIYEKELKKEYHKMYKNPTKIPNCTGIIQRDRATIVTWDDNTKTTIVAEKGFDENEHMLFDAFCIAFTKKMLGSTTNILKTIEKNDTDKHNRILKEAEKNFRKNRDLAQKKEDRIRREKKFNEMVDEEFMRMRAVEEAKKHYICNHKEK